jgi:hypothetical protein
MFEAFKAWNAQRRQDKALRKRDLAMLEYEKKVGEYEELRRITRTSSEISGGIVHTMQRLAGEIRELKYQLGLPLEEE